MPSIKVQCAVTSQSSKPHLRSFFVPQMAVSPADTSSAYPHQVDICFQVSSTLLEWEGVMARVYLARQFLGQDVPSQAFLAVSLLICALHDILLCCIDTFAF